MAERLGIEWRALRWSQPQIVSSKNIDLNAAPPTDAETAPLSFEYAPDTWLRLLIEFFKPTDAVLFRFAQPASRAGHLAQEFTRQEFVNVVRPLGCNISERSIYRVFEDVFEHDNHPLFAKLDPSLGSSSRNRKFQLRSEEDIKRRIVHAVRYRVYESTFHKHRDTLIDFKVFNQAKLGSELAITLESALEPLYQEQKERFESLKHVCEQKIAAYQNGHGRFVCHTAPGLDHR